MAYTGTLTTEAEINSFAGENVDATGNTEANHNTWTKQAESFLIVLSKYNWIDHYSSLNADIKGILSEYVARYAAIAAISFNMVNYSSRIEAEDMINIHLQRLNEIKELLSNQDYIKFITIQGGV